MSDMQQIYDAQVRAGTLQPDPAQAAVLPEFDRIRTELAKPIRRGLFRKAPDPIRGLYLWGGVGSGKSMLMDLFVDNVKDVSIRRVHFHAFMQEIHTGMHEARKLEVDDAIAPVAEKIIASVRCLAFDEMQITDITDAMIVGRLFEMLFTAGVVVVSTSNRVPDDLYKNGLNRQLFLPFIELIKTRMAVHELESPKDYRQHRLQGATTYFSPISADTRAQIQAVWNDFSGGAAAPLTLDVKGREVILPAFRNGVARATFYDLCGRPLGPADYLAIVGAVKVLVLEDIPRLSRSNFNEAKRFVTLIDALYEARTRLICSAAAQPDMLYVEGDGAFEFERTASRLQEMQSAEWNETP